MRRYSDPVVVAQCCIVDEGWSLDGLIDLGTFELRTAAVTRAAVMAGARAVADDVASGGLARIGFPERAPERSLTALRPAADAIGPAHAPIAIAHSTE